MEMKTNPDNGTKVMNVLGQETRVRKYLTYKEKLDTASELVERATVCDREAGICYEGHLTSAMIRFMQVKAYTELDVTKYEGEDGLCELMDAWHEYSEDMDAFEETIDRDWYGDYGVEALADQMRSNITRLFETMHSLPYKIATSFAFLLNGNDLTDSLAKASGVNEQMIGFMDALKKLPMDGQKPIDLSMYAKKR